jgi:hypothetical protein
MTPPTNHFLSTGGLVRSKLLSVLVIAVGLALAGAAKAGVTYKVNLAISSGGHVGSIVGTITTDGKNGVIGVSNILAWDLTGTGNGGSSLHIVTGPSVVEVGNNTAPFNISLGTPDLTADANHLYFNFSATDGGFLAFQAGTNLFAGQSYIGFGATNNSDVYQGLSVVPGSVFDSSLISQGEAGNQIIASVSATANVTLSLQRSGAGFQLTWPQGVLLEADRVTGPWTTNVATSPLIVISPSSPQRFYRLLLQ